MYAARGAGRNAWNTWGMQSSQEPLICHTDTWCSVEPERQTIFVGTAAGGSIGMQLGARGAMPGIPGSMQMNQGPPRADDSASAARGPPAAIAHYISTDARSF